jgi:hypothetical protein
MNDMPERDLVLEGLLGSLAAPPARERFHERLWQRIEATEAQSLLDTLEAPPARERFHERLWERIEAAEPKPVAAGPRRWGFRRPRVAVAALAAAAVAVWVAVSFVGWPLGREQGVLSGPPPAAADVLENVRLRLDSARSLSAVFTYERAGAPVYTARVLATSDGRVRTSAVAGEDGSWRLPAADAALTGTPGLHVEVTSMLDGTRTEAWNGQGGLTVARTVNLAPGPPDAAGSWLFPTEYGGEMSALSIAGSKVSSSTYEGRRVLVVSAPAPVQARSPDRSSAAPPRYDEVSMVIDRETWLPIRVVRSFRGTAVESWGLSDVKLDAPLMASDFTVQLPASAELVTGSDQGFRRLSLEEASAAVGGRLFVPATLPDGFELSLATVKTPEPRTDEPLISNESSVASLVYRRGFRSIVVTTRSFDGALADPADDPFAASTTSGTPGARQVALRSGGLTGAKARVSAPPLGLPHLWARQNGLLVTVAGDVTRRELVDIAGSLEPYGVWRTRQTFTAYVTATKAYDLSTLSDLYSGGVEIDGKLYGAEDAEDAVISNSEMTDYLVSGKTVSTLVGDGSALWEGWPGEYVAVGGWYSPEAVAEVVTARGERVTRQQFFWIGGLNRKAGEKSPHPVRLSTPLGAADTAAAARSVARAYAAALKDKDAAALARLSALDVVFLDVGYGDHGRRSALRRRYERMFAFPTDLAFDGVRTFSGPGWAVVRWDAASDSLGYEGVAGLTVLEVREGKIARQTLYCQKGDMPFR